MAKAVSIKKEVTKKLRPAVSLIGEAYFTETQLPTHEEVVKHYLDMKKTFLEKNEGKKEPLASVVAIEVLTALREIWIKGSVPTISHQPLLAKGKQCCGSYRKTKKTLQEN